MIQMRLKEGTGNRWFNPARDLAYLWPLIIRRALTSFDDFQDTPECSREEMVIMAGEYGKLLTHIIKNPVEFSEAQKGLIEIEEKHPAAMALIKHRVFHVTHGIYAAWIADAKPKAGTDAEIPSYGLDEVASQLARASILSQPRIVNTSSVDFVFGLKKASRREVAIALCACPYENRRMKLLEIKSVDPEYHDDIVVELNKLRDEARQDCDQNSGPK